MFYAVSTGAGDPRKGTDIATPVVVGEVPEALRAGSAPVFKGRITEWTVLVKK